MDAYYKHSGKVEPAGVILMTVLGLAGAVVLSIPYGYGLVHVDIDKIHILLPLLYGFGIGAILALGSRLGKIRNNAITLIISILVALVGLYSVWVAWAYAMSGKVWGQSVLLIEPDRLLTFLRAYLKVGTWIYFGGKDDHATQGTPLLMIWIAEGAAIVGTAVVTSVAISRVRPFCERCGMWVTHHLKLPALVQSDPKELKRNLELRNYDPLLNAEKAGIAQPHFQVDLQGCQKCRQFAVMSVSSVKPATKGSQKAESKIVRNLLIDSDAYSRLAGLTTAPIK